MTMGSIDGKVAVSTRIELDPVEEAPHLLSSRGGTSRVGTFRFQVSALDSSMLKPSRIASGDVDAWPEFNPNMLYGGGSGT
jgi:hypothetical protein